MRSSLIAKSSPAISRLGSNNLDRKGALEPCKHFDSWLRINFTFRTPWRRVGSQSPGGADCITTSEQTDAKRSDYTVAALLFSRSIRDLKSGTVPRPKPTQLANFASPTHITASRIC